VTSRATPLVRPITATGTLGADDGVELGKLLLEDVAVEKEEGREGLRLRGRAHRAFDGQVHDEGVDLRLGHLERVPLVVKEDEAADPSDVRLFGPQAVVASSDRHPDAIEQPRLPGRRTVRGRGPGTAIRHDPAV
jgi:hypothetical protein